MLQSKNVANVGLNAGWINGWADSELPARRRTTPVRTRCRAPALAHDDHPDQHRNDCSEPDRDVLRSADVGLAVQSYSTTGLPGVNPNVLSNYGGNFVHKYLRDIR